MKPQIPNEFELIETGKILEGDYIFYNSKMGGSDDLSKWEKCEGLIGSTVESCGNSFIIRPIANKFPLGSKVMFEFRNHRLPATVWSYGTRTDTRVVKLDKEIELKNELTGLSLEFIDVSIEYLKEYRPITIGEYEVEVAEGGVKVGCTFVSDEQIKQVAKLRGLKVD
jgi:hypothetical protein